MEVIYRAVDGREFESEDKCREYEQSSQPRDARMFDVDGEETHEYDAAYFIVNTKYLDRFEFEKIRDNLEYTYYREIGGAAGYSNHAGIYVWVNDKYVWWTFQDCRALRKILDTIGK